MDFDELPVLGIKDYDYSKLIKNGKSKIGIVFNLENHNQSGSHWVSMFSDLKKGQVYYFDSYGTRPEQRVRTLLDRIKNFCETGLGIKSVIVDHNRIRHQFKNFFIIEYFYNYNIHYIHYIFY